MLEQPTDTNDLQRRIQHFWASKTLEGQRAKHEVRTPKLPLMRLQLGLNELDPDLDASRREVSAFWFDDSGTLVGYARASLMGHRRAGKVLSAADFIGAMDEVDQHNYDLACVLVDSHLEKEPFLEVALGVRWLAEFCILELHPNKQGRGLGTKLGTQFLDELRNRYAIGLFILKPFPLQYSQGDGPRVRVEQTTHPKEFERDCAKLQHLYAREWCAQALPGSTEYWLVNGSESFIPQLSQSAWCLQRQAQR